MIIHQKITQGTVFCVERTQGTVLRVHCRVSNPSAGQTRADAETAAEKGRFHPADKPPDRHKYRNCQKVHQKIERRELSPVFTLRQILSI